MNTVAPRPFKLLAALDLTEGSPGVLSRTFEIAASRDASEVHVVAVLPLVEGVATPLAAESSDERVDAAMEALRSFVAAQADDHLRRHPEMPMHGRIQVHSVLGRPAPEIVWLAAHLDADLIVVGTHGRRGVRRFLLGSVAEEVCRFAGCPVQVVREKHHVAAAKAPQIEPVCPECAAVRNVSAGSELWCRRHAVHHLRAHVVCRGEHGPGPSPVESITGI